MPGPGLNASPNRQNRVGCFRLLNNLAHALQQVNAPHAAALQLCARRAFGGDADPRLVASTGSACERDTVLERLAQTARR